MSNHIAAKFLGFIYAPIPQEMFSKQIPELADALRGKLPRYEIKSINDISVNISDNNVATQQATVASELHMVDATGLWGLKIGNNGLSLSTSEYVDYDAAVSFLEGIIGIIVDILGVTHFSRTTLRNINLFDEKPNDPNMFNDIKNNDYWGRQEFPTLKSGYICNGAATRHEYFSHTYTEHIQILSGIVIGTHQSFIPHDEWDIWRLRGEIPRAGKTQLLIDIAVTSFQGQMNKPEKQNNVTPYNWEAVLRDFDKLHLIVNKVYSDITTD